MLPQAIICGSWRQRIQCAEKEDDQAYGCLQALARSVWSPRKHSGRGNDCILDKYADICYWRPFPDLRQLDWLNLTAKR